MTTLTVKSTVNLNRYYKEQLEYLVSINKLDSVTEGINLAIADFVKAKQKELYAARMKEASQDKEFIERTMSSQKDFERLDSDFFSEDESW